jgi:hypothetical protein
MPGIAHLPWPCKRLSRHAIDSTSSRSFCKSRRKTALRPHQDFNHNLTNILNGWKGPIIADTLLIKTSELPRRTSSTITFGRKSASGAPVLKRPAAALNFRPQAEKANAREGFPCLEPVSEPRDHGCGQGGRPIHAGIAHRLTARRGGRFSAGAHIRGDRLNRGGRPEKRG